MSGDFDFVGRACLARYGRTSVRCLLPMMHCDGRGVADDHEGVKADGTIVKWHPRTPEKWGHAAPVEEPT